MIGGRQPEMSGLRQLPNNEQTLFTSLSKGNYSCMSLLLKKNQSWVFFMVHFSLSSSDLTLCLGAIVNHNWDCLSETVVCTIRKTLQHKIILKGSYIFIFVQFLGYSTNTYKPHSLEKMHLWRHFGRSFLHILQYFQGEMSSERH